MTCTTDYAAIGSLDARMHTFLTEAHDGAVPVHKAVSLAALAANECGEIWNQARTPELLFAPLTCWECRACVGWEFAIKNGVHVLNSVNREPAATQYLLDQQLATRAADGTLTPTQKLSTPANNVNIARWFEWAIINRRADLLTNWSIGPTQMHLLWSALTIGNTPGRGTNIDPRWLNSWDDIFNFYMAHSAVARANAITYLDPSYNGVPHWPSEQPDNADLAIAWLTPRQLGNKAAATTYYNSIYKKYLAMAVSVAHSLGQL